MSKKDKGNILAILEAIEKIRKYVAGIKTPREYIEKTIVFDATLMNFVVIGEMVDRISEQVKSEFPSVDWQKVKDFRNLVAHDYLGIDAEEVWQIIHEHLPQLSTELEKIIKRLSSEGKV